MAKYKGLNKPVKRSAAAKQADDRNKAMKKTKSGNYQSLSASGKPKRMPTRLKRAIQVEVFKAQIVPQPPRTPITEKGMSLKGLRRNTPRLMRENGEECSLTAVKTMRTGKGLPAIQANVQHKDPLRPEKIVRRHQAIIVGLDDPNKPIHLQKRVMVSCPCENYVFMWEYANAVHGCARIVYGNGEPPTMTNISQMPALCKHLSRLSDYVIQEGL